MTCNNEKPLQGFHDAVVNDTAANIIIVVGGIISAVGTVKSIVDLFKGDPMTALIIARVVELGAGTVVAAFIWFLWYQKCQDNTRGDYPCFAGIVDSLTPPATSVTTIDPTTDIARFMEQNTDIFPFMKEHPCFNLVVRCIYWPIISDNTGYIWYNGKDEPYITCYIKDPRLCQKMMGAAIGATIGGIGGAAAGFYADAAALAICGASIFCAIFAILVGAIVAIVCACVGAKIGFEASEPGRVESGEPTSSETAQRTMRVGDYVAVKGNMVRLSWLHNANALYFTEEWCWYGHENTLAPYTHETANAFFEPDSESSDGNDKEYWFCKMGISP
jgi:hypothetical protein